MGYNDYRIKQDKDSKVSRIEYFNEHWYKIEETGETYPSPSLILETISKGYGYDEWLRSVGHESNYISREAMDSGSKLHNAFEQLIWGNTIKAESEDAIYTKREWKIINQWINWYTFLKVKPIATELIVYDIERKIAGTLDFICEINGEVWVLDWKTGNNIYETGKLQVAFYGSSYNNLITRGKLDHPKAIRAALVHCGAKNKTQKDLCNAGIKVEELDVRADLKSFDDTLSLWNRFNPNAKAPTDEYNFELSLPESQVIKL